MFSKALFWARTDEVGTDLALLNDGHGLYARGVTTAIDPVPLTCRYELITDETWAVARLELAVEGAGWLRTLKLERAAGRWRASTAEQGDLDAALTRAGHPRVGLPGTEEPERLHDAIDVDLYAAPLFNTLPIRRLNLLKAAPGTEHRLTMAFVRLPSLEVMPNEQIYTAIDATTVRYASGSFTADLTVDAEGYVTHYPGLAVRKP
ncbi:putative glycolipid-binding domain-containing protein [Actinomycetes bacterium KLBMP 9797]